MLWSAEVHRLLGVPDTIRTAPMAQFLDRVHKADQAAARVALDRVLDDGRAAGVMGTLRDITERTAAENRIRFLAYYDSLTNLPPAPCRRCQRSKTPGSRRLRHRLFVAHLPQGAADRRAQDRPLVHP